MDMSDDSEDDYQYNQRANNNKRQKVNDTMDDGVYADELYGEEDAEYDGTECAGLSLGIEGLPTITVGTRLELKCSIFQEKHRGSLAPTDAFLSKVIDLQEPRPGKQYYRFRITTPSTLPQTSRDDIILRYLISINGVQYVRPEKKKQKRGFAAQKHPMNIEKQQRLAAQQAAAAQAALEAQKQQEQATQLQHATLHQQPTSIINPSSGTTTLHHVQGGGKAPPHHMSMHHPLTTPYNANTSTFTFQQPFATQSTAHGPNNSETSHPSHDPFGTLTNVNLSHNINTENSAVGPHQSILDHQNKALGPPRFSTGSNLSNTSQTSATQSLAPLHHTNPILTHTTTNLHTTNIFGLSGTGSAVSGGGGSLTGLGVTASQPIPMHQHQHQHQHHHHTTAPSISNIYGFSPMAGSPPLIRLGSSAAPRQPLGQGIIAGMGPPITGLLGSNTNVQLSTTRAVHHTPYSAQHINNGTYFPSSHGTTHLSASISNGSGVPIQPNNISGNNNATNTSNIIDNTRNSSNSLTTNTIHTTSNLNNLHMLISPKSGSGPYTSPFPPTSTTTTTAQTLPYTLNLHVQANPTLGNSNVSGGPGSTLLVVPKPIQGHHRHTLSTATYNPLKPAAIPTVTHASTPRAAQPNSASNGANMDDQKESLSSALTQGQGLSVDPTTGGTNWNEVNFDHLALTNNNMTSLSIVSPSNTSLMTNGPPIPPILASTTTNAMAFQRNSITAHNLGQHYIAPHQTNPFHTSISHISSPQPPRLTDAHNLSVLSAGSINNPPHSLTTGSGVGSPAPLVNTNTTVTLGAGTGNTVVSNGKSTFYHPFHPAGSGSQAHHQPHQSSFGAPQAHQQVSSGSPITPPISHNSALPATSTLNITANPTNPGQNALQTGPGSPNPHSLNGKLMVGVTPTHFLHQQSQQNNFPLSTQNRPAMLNITASQPNPIAGLFTHTNTTFIAARNASNTNNNNINSTTMSNGGSSFNASAMSATTPMNHHKPFRPHITNSSSSSGGMSGANPLQLNIAATTHTTMNNLTTNPRSGPLPPLALQSPTPTHSASGNSAIFSPTATVTTQHANSSTSSCPVGGPLAVIYSTSSSGSSAPAANTGSSTGMGTPSHIQADGTNNSGLFTSRNVPQLSNANSNEQHIPTVSNNNTVKKPVSAFNFQ